MVAEIELLELAALLDDRPWVVFFLREESPLTPLLNLEIFVESIAGEISGWSGSNSPAGLSLDWLSAMEVLTGGASCNG